MASKVKAKDLQLGDVVRIPNVEPWGTAVVQNVTDCTVVLFRPYGVSEDFSYTGGVICYTGVENYSIPRDRAEYELWERKVLK